MESPGALPSEGLVFQLVCCFHRYWACSSKSTVWPKMESCFKDRACSVSSFKLSVSEMCLTTEPPPVRDLLCSREQGWEWELACGRKPKEKRRQEQRGSSDLLVIRPVPHSELHSSHHAPRSALGMLCFIKVPCFHHYSYPKPPLIKMD